MKYIFLLSKEHTIGGGKNPKSCIWHQNVKGQWPRVTNMKIFKDIKRAVKEVTLNKIIKITKIKCRGMGTIFKLSRKKVSW